MRVNTDNAFLLEEAVRNFARVAETVDEKGSVVLVRNGAPRYLLLDFAQAEEEETASDGEVMKIAERMLKINLRAYRELAK